MAKFFEDSKTVQRWVQELQKLVFFTLTRLRTSANLDQITSELMRCKQVSIINYSQ